MSHEVRFRMLKTRGGWDGIVTLPFLPGGAAALAQQLPPAAAAQLPADASSVAIKVKAKSKGAAVKKAAGAAMKLLDNPMVQAAMPPQVAMALNIAKKLPLKKLKKLKFW
jgi:hypothetical protein